MQEIEIIDNRKVPTSFQSFHGNSNNKTNLVKYVFQKQRETLSKVLTFSESIYLTNLDGGTDRVTNQRNERIDFYCHHKEADTKIFSYIKFLCDNTRLRRISLYESLTNLTFLDAICFKTGADQRRSEIYALTHLLASKLGLPICCLLLAMRAMSGCDSVNTFLHIEKKQHHSKH